MSWKCEIRPLRKDEVIPSYGKLWSTQNLAITKIHLKAYL
jgi:hypothetical protein